MSNDKVTVNGYVKDKSSGEELIGAYVVVKSLNAGTTTNEYGFFSLTLPVGTHEIEVYFLGYRPFKKSITLQKGKVAESIIVELEPEGIQLQEIEITSEKNNAHIREIGMSSSNISVQTVQTLPALFGEYDILRTLQLLPGVQSAGEGNTGFYVRGGGPDQNLLLLDEAVVFNAGHFMGFFSVFNTDAIKDVDIYKGGIPARYGGRISSLIDIRMKEGNNKKFTAKGGIGLISSRLTIEGPIIKEKSSFIISGRRTYADLFLKFSPDATVRNNQLYFYDLNAKANYRLSKRDRIFISGYFGRDVFAFSNLFAFDWGNATLTARWNHLFSERLFSNLTFIYSNFDYSFTFTQDENNAARLTSTVRNIGCKADFSYFSRSNSKFYYGLNFIAHRFNPGVFEPVGEKSFYVPQRLDYDYGLETALYYDHEWEITPRWGIRYGLRLSMFNAMGPKKVYTFAPHSDIPIDTTYYPSNKFIHTYLQPEPRLTLRYAINEEQSLKFSYSRTAQFVHQASNSTSSLPVDLWILSSKKVRPQLADQVVLGYFRNFWQNKLEASVEVYYKWMQNQIDYRDQADLFFNDKLERELLIGNGWSYGVEWLVKKNIGKFSGWISYTLSQTQRQIEGINQNQPYPAKNDRRHSIAIVASWQISRRVLIATNWVYYTGFAVTFPSGGYRINDRFVPYFTERNGYRMPDYHRLDISLTLYPKYKPNQKFSSNWNFSVYNLYGRKNAWAINFREKQNSPGQTEAVMIYLFSFVPSITWNFEF
ncbi:MAG: TonB-dependent receptor [Bacteroidia bacterium]|nr:TonB-dependent receptor [Bacteroidia bacterium]MDW8157676.1 TonB-dependent receptor [Bacteroidia bacterium]